MYNKYVATWRALSMGIVVAEKYCCTNHFDIKRIFQQKNVHTGVVGEKRVVVN
jgi:hypothetical protein